MSEIFPNSTAVSDEEIFKPYVSEEFYKRGDELLKYITSELLTIKDFPESASPNKSLSDLKNTKIIFKLKKNVTVQKTILIKDEAFLLDIKEDSITISHPVWSLIGHGINLYDALKDLMKLSYEVFKSLADDKPSELTEEANNLRNFLFKVF